MRLAANVIAIWQKSQRKCSETGFHKLYMVGLEVACVLFRRICTYTDTLFLGFMQKSDVSVQRNSLAIWCVSNKKVMTVLHKQVICFSCASVCVCVCGHNIISPSRWWISLGLGLERTLEKMQSSPRNLAEKK